MNLWENISLVDMPNELWNDVIGYEGFYQVSNLGRIKSLGTSGKHSKLIILKQNFWGAGYLFVTLFKNKESKCFSSHVLVAKAFIPNPENKPEVNHKWGIKTDNRVSELEWNTQSENRKHAYAHGFNRTTKHMLGKNGKLHHNSKKVKQIDIHQNVVREFYGTREASRETNISQISISRAARGVVKTAGGYKWEYA